MLKDPFQRTSRGQGAAEYALILALLALAVIISMQLTGYSVRDVYCSVARSFGVEGGTCATQQVYCEDDFVNLDGWQTNWGTFTNPEGKLCTSGAAKNYNTCSQSMANMSDYSVSISGAELTQGNGYGVFFRGTELDGSTSGYTVQYDPGWGGGAIIMRKWVNGRELEPFATYRMPAYDWYSDSHDLRIDVQGDTFTVYLNGEEVLVGQDDTYSEGGVGLRSWDSTEVCMDNFQVGELPYEGAQ